MYKIVGSDGKEYGPVTSDQLRQWITQGRANADTRVLPEGADQWVLLGSLPEFGLAPAPGTAPPPPLRTWPAAPFQTSQPPGSIRVFGIINIVLGSLGLLCLPFTMIGLVLMPAAMEQFSQSPLLKQWMMVSSVLSILGSILMLTSGIGLVKYKAWARKLAVYYAAFASVMNVVGSFIMFGAAQSSSIHGPEMMVSTVFGTIIRLVYNLLLIYFLTRREARQALGETA
jgi:hypothetical protein